MRVHRFLATAALCAAVVASGATAGCGVVKARWSAPEPPATMPPDQDGTADDVPPPRSNTLEMSGETLYFLEGKLPTSEFDGTTAAFGGSLVLRAQCHDGSLDIEVSAPVGIKRVAVNCDGKSYERPMGRVKPGDPLGVTATGSEGTDFAIELAAS